MNEFQNAELRGRTVVENLIKEKVINYEFTKDPYNPIDLFITGSNGTFSVEIKNRRPYTSEQIESYGGHWIMKHKWDDLMEAYENSGYTPYFLAIFQDIIALWNLTTIEPVWKEKEFERNNYTDHSLKDYQYTELHLSSATHTYKTEKYINP